MRKLVVRMSAKDEAEAAKPEVLGDDEIFALTRERWPSARGIVRTKMRYADFRVTSETKGKPHETDRVDRSEAIDVQGWQVGYSERAQMIVVFQ